MLRHMSMSLVRILAPVIVLLAGCGGSETSAVTATEVRASSAATGEPAAPPSAGRLESLECGEDRRTSGLKVDYGADAVGHPTPADAAHLLADEQKFPRSRYIERAATSSLERPVFEYMTEDGRVVAYVTIEQWVDGKWMASGITACQSSYEG